MTETLHLTFVAVDDWEAIYDGDELVTEGHTITMKDLSELAEGKPFTLRCHPHSNKLDEVIPEIGNFPDRLSDLPE